MDKIEKIIEMNKYRNKFEYMRIWDILDIINNSLIQDNISLHNNIFVIKFFKLLEPESDPSIYDTILIPDYDGTEYKKAFFDYLGEDIETIKSYYKDTYSILYRELQKN